MLKFVFVRRFSGFLLPSLDWRTAFIRGNCVVAEGMAPNIDYLPLEPSIFPANGQYPTDPIASLAVSWPGPPNSMTWPDRATQSLQKENMADNVIASTSLTMVAVCNLTQKHGRLVFFG